MADKTVIVEINYDTDAAIKNVNQLTQAIEGERVAQAKLKAELESGAISQNEYSKQVEESKTAMNKANAERKNYINQLAQEKGSINEIKAQIKTLTAERDKLNSKTDEGRAAIKAYNAQLEALNKSLDESKGKNTGFLAALQAMPGPLGGIVSGIGAMTKAAMAFVMTPFGAIITAIVLAFKALQSYLKGSEEGQNRLNKIVNVGKAIFEALMNVVEKVGKIIFDAISKPKETIQKLGEMIKENLINRFQAFGVIGKAIAKIFSGEFKEGFKDLANGAVQMTTGIEGGLKGIKKMAEGVRDSIKGIIDDTKNNIKLANELSKIQSGIDKKEREMLVSREKNATAISELRLKATQKDIFSQKERLAFLQQAENLIKSYTKTEENLAKAKYDAAVLNMKISGDDKENLTKVAEAEAELIRVRRNSLDERRAISKQIATLIMQEGDEERKKAEEVNKALTDFQNELAKNQEDVNKDRIKSEQDTLDSLFELREDYNSQYRELEAEDAEARGRAIVEAAELERELTEQQAELKRQQLEENLAQLQEIIAASQGLADTRVMIASDTFAKLSSINWDEVKDKKDAFIAIGNAAKGLTGLITAGFDNQAKSLEQNKAKELALAGDNLEARAAIEATFAKKEEELKKQQAKREKAKAIVDATIATALAVVNSLKMGVPMGLVFAAIAAGLGAVQIASIASQPATYAKGGMIGGKPHSQGGTKFYGEDGSMFEAERGEAMFVLKKDATAEIAALGMINESFGGRSWTSAPAPKLADGGEVATAQPVDIEQQIDAAFQRTPIYVRVGDIETGMTESRNVKQAGVI